jgi:hypothetical protein
MQIDLGESLKPSKIEWIAIVVFAVSMLITLNYPLCAPLTLITILLLLIGEHFLINEQFRKKTVKISRWLFILLLILFITDALSTYYMVLIEKVAYEGNPIVVWLWDNCGVILGEIIRISVALSMFSLVFYKLNPSKPKQSLLAVLVLFFMIFAWIITDYNNLSLLFEYTCQA